MISDFYDAIIKNPLELIGGPITGLIYGLKGIDKSYNPFQDVSGLVDSIFGNGTVSSFMNTQTQAGPTGRDLWLSDREDTKYQRQSADMEAAGLNQAMMYSGGQNPQAPSTASGNGVSLSDLLELVSLPKQLKLLDAQIANVGADTSEKEASARNIEQRTLTEEYETVIRRIAAEYGYDFKEGELERLWSEIGVNYAESEYKESLNDLVHSQKEAQDITNDYLPNKFERELNELASRANQEDKSALLSSASAAFTTVQANFARENGFLMSQSDNLLVATYLCSLLGLEKSDITTVVARGLNALKPKKPESDPIVKGYSKQSNKPVESYLYHQGYKRR